MTIIRETVVLIGVLGACGTEHLGEHASDVLTDPRYEIRIAETAIGANGHTKHEVFVFGTTATGTFAVDEVVVGIDRPAGTFTRTELALGPLGATTHFIPCDHGSSGCVGAATLTLARATAPTTPIATRSIDLGPPTHVSTLAPCLGGDTVMYLDGNDFIRNAMLRVIEWGDEFTDVAPAASPSELRLSLTPRKLTQGNNWGLLIDSYQLGVPLAPGLYENAAIALSRVSGQPGLRVAGNGHGCNQITGTFEVHELAVTAGTLDTVAVTFEQHCEASATTLLEGCFRYARP